MTHVVVNGTPVEVDGSPVRRLSSALRDDLGLTGTKVGCDAGDCGACTVLIDGEPAAACLTAVGAVAGRRVETIEGLTASGALESLQRSFRLHGAAQCGICTPGMLVAAAALLDRTATPTTAEVTDALGGVLCRCTGYRKIIDAVVAAGDPSPTAAPPPGKAVGFRVERVDGLPKVTGDEVFGDDATPVGASTIKVVRSPYHRARFEVGDLDAFVAATPGIEAVMTAADVPGTNRFGVIPSTVDQPVFAEDATRFRGEAVAMIVGEPDAIVGLDEKNLPIIWSEEAPILGVAAARSPDAPRLHADRDGNLLTTGYVQRGDVDVALARSDGVTVSGEYSTGFIEHAYIEPEAGHAVRIGDRLELFVSTQSPHMDRTAVAAILGIDPEDVRIRPSAVGGGFGSKLDLSVQPYLALAAWTLGRPVRLAYTRPESMMATTKRHPADMTIRVAATASGELTAMDFTGVFDTGAYASWGPTVANRVPVHAGGPYAYAAYRARTAAYHTSAPPSGAFRGFGVPQAAIAQECLFDELADAVGVDRLEFRFRNALTAGVPTVTGQVFDSGVGYRDCLAALRPHWQTARSDAASANREGGRNRRGVGLAGMWYGCGNTALPNPSTIRVGLDPEGRFVLFQGAVDIGQGANTVMTQICADGLGVEMSAIDRVDADTDSTPDAGKTSASRQTYVTGNATNLAATALRQRLLALAGASVDARLEPGPGRLTVHDRGRSHVLDLTTLPVDDRGLVAVDEATYDPPTTPLDDHGQGDPYAVFGFGAHLVELTVDVELGTVELLRVVAAHDVGRAVNPMLVEGQIEGGIAQGIGLALMEEYLPGRNENLHDYLIPTIGDVPEVTSILVESVDPHGPYGAKGIGEHSLIPTAPAILNAIRDAVGAPVRHVPATPERVLAAVAEGRR